MLVVVRIIRGHSDNAHILLHVVKRPNTGEGVLEMLEHPQMTSHGV